MIGRGTRKTPTKDRCLVFDYADDFADKDLAALATVFGLPPRFDCAGESILGQVRAIEELESELGALPLEEVGSFTDLQALLQRLDPLKLYAFTAPETEDHSSFRWQRKGEGHFTISWRNRGSVELQKRLTLSGFDVPPQLRRPRGGSRGTGSESV